MNSLPALELNEYINLVPRVLSLLRSRERTLGTRLRIHLRVYYFGQHQRWERLRAFFAPVNNNLKAESLQTKEWFKAGPVGINKLYSLMKTMAQKAGINNDRLQNHSGRKTMIQTLSENDTDSTDSYLSVVRT